MKNFAFLVFSLAIFNGLLAQNYNLPPKPKAGKCYEMCFDYEKKVEWKALDCDKIKAEKNKTKTQRRTFKN